MKPSEVHVIWNKITHEIKFVTSEEFMAQRVLKKLLDIDEITGSTSNEDKLVICTLGRAIAEMTNYYEDRIKDIRESYGLEIMGLKKLNNALANQL